MDITINMKLTITILFTALLSIVGYAQEEIIDKVVATVGSEIVLLSELEEQRALIQAQQGGLPEGARCGILDQLMANKLLVNQAKLDSLEVTDQEVETQLNTRIERILELMGGSPQAFEDYYGQTVGEVKDAFREDLRNQILSERMRGQIMANVRVTPAEVKQFFANIPQDSLPYFNSEVEIGEIVYVPEVNPTSKQAAREKVAEYRRRIVEDGEDFAELASKYSDDFGSARLGGDLGLTKRGKFVPEFEAEAYKLDPMEISPVFESPFGYHIIQLMERRGNAIRTRHILVKPELTDDDLAKAEQRLDSIRQVILSDSMLWSLAVKRYGSEDAQSYTNDGRMVNAKTGNTFFEVADLEPDIYFTIDTMSVGSISQPIAGTGPTGEPEFRLIQLQSQTNPHVANLKQDYSKIRTATMNQKQNIYINEWVERKVGSTFIQVTEAFRECPNLSKWTGEGTKP